MPIKEFIGLRNKMYSYHKSLSKIEELTEVTIEYIKKYETLKNTQLIKSPNLEVAAF